MDRELGMQVRFRQLGDRALTSGQAENRSFENLTDVFKCMICMEKLQDARLCPCCSKLCCYSCVRRWLLERATCPHCRQPLHTSKLVVCRWVEDVLQQLSSLTESFPRSPPSAAEHSDWCHCHNEKLSVFCQTCQQCICHQCALWDADHQGHTFDPLKQIYQRSIQAVSKELKEVRRRLVLITQIVDQVHQKKSLIHDAKATAQQEYTDTIQKIYQRLDAQLLQKLDLLNCEQVKLDGEAKRLKEVMDDVENRIRQSSCSEVIKDTSAMLDRCSKTTAQPLQPVTASSLSTEFISELVPQYDSLEMKLNNFRELRCQGNVVYSEPLQMCGLCWRLKVYPDGSSSVRGHFLSVFLELVRGYPEQSEYEYRLEMIHVASSDPLRGINREFVSKFEVGECWGFNRFFRLDDLEDSGYLGNGNFLLLRFHVRAPTFFQKCRDQAWYIDQLEQSLACTSRQVNCPSSLRRQVNEEASSEASGERTEPARESAACRTPQARAAHSCTFSAPNVEPLTDFLQLRPSCRGEMSTRTLSESDQQDDRQHPTLSSFEDMSLISIEGEEENEMSVSAANVMLFSPPPSHTATHIMFSSVQESSDGESDDDGVVIVPAAHHLDADRLHSVLASFSTPPLSAEAEGQAVLPSAPLHNRADNCEYTSPAGHQVLSHNTSAGQQCCHENQSSLQQPASSEFTTPENLGSHDNLASVFDNPAIDRQGATSTSSINRRLQPSVVNSSERNSEAHHPVWQNDGSDERSHSTTSRSAVCRQTVSVPLPSTGGQSSENQSATASSRRSSLTGKVAESAL